MNQNNFYNKLPINDINWHIVMKNYPEGVTEKELFNAIKNPFPPSLIILKNYYAQVNYNTVKEAVESIRSNIFKKIRDKEIILHFNMSYLRKRAYRFTIFKVDLKDFENHTYKSLYYHFVQYGDILAIEKIYKRRRIDIYYPSQGEAKIAEKNAREYSLEIFPNTPNITTEVISPFTGNSQKLTNLAYAITIPIPSNSEDNTKIQSFSVKPQKNKNFNPMDYIQNPIHMKINNHHHQDFNGISMGPSYHNNYNYYDINDPMNDYPINDEYPMMNMNMNNPNIMNNNPHLPSFQKTFQLNQTPNGSSRTIRNIIRPEYNDNINNFNKNQIHNNKLIFNNNLNYKSKSNKNPQSNVIKNIYNSPNINNKSKNNNINTNIVNNKINNNNEIGKNNNKNNNSKMKINNNLNEKKIKSNNSKIKNSVQAKKDVSKKNKVKNIDNEKMNKNQNSKIKNKINENKEKTNLNNYDKVKNISRKNGNKNNENNKRLLDNTDEENEKKRQKKNSTVYMKQSPKILNQSLNDNKKILKKNYIGQNNNDCNVKNDILKTNNESIRKIQEKENDFKPKNVNTIKLESKNIKEASNTTNKQSKLHSNSNKSEINTNSNNNINIKNYNNNSMNDSLKIKTIIDLKEKHDLSITNPLNSVVLSKENNSNNNSQIKIKYNTKSKKNTKNDNNKVISTSYNFVRFENVTLSKYCYQYHFLYKYRCNKCCESITWGGYNDCDDYKQYKLYIDNSDYSLSVLTTDLYSINNPAIIRQMAYDEVVNYNNINYIGDVEYERSINHNLIYSQQLNILLSNIDNQHYYIWNLKNNKYQTYNYDKNSIHDLKEPSLKLQYNGILHDSITLSGSGVFGLDSDGNLAKWNLDTIPSMNESDKMSICSINPQSIIKLQNNEKIKKIKTYSNNNQEILIALSTNNNIMFYDLKNDDFKPINNFKKAHNSNITTIDINPINSFYVLTGGDDNFIKIWDLRNPSAELISSCYYSNGINKLRWCPHLSNTFCCSSKNGIISIWSMNSLSENKPLMINNEHQSNRPVKVDFEWNPHKEQEGTIASVDKPGINNIRDSCVQVWRPLVYTYLYNGLIK